MEKKITMPLTAEKTKELHAGDNVLISGVIYTGRDAAHKRLVELIQEGKPLPIDVKDSVIYYVGPAPAKPGQVIGSAGPTTSYRMDAYAPALLDLGLKGMIGKGRRSAEVVQAIREHGAVYFITIGGAAALLAEAVKKNGAVYFGAIGGAGALLAKCIKKAEIVCYEDLGAEAVRRLEVENLPVVVVIDSQGNNLYEDGRKQYLDDQKEEKAEQE